MKDTEEQSRQGTVTNYMVRDSSAKLIFEDNILCSQFLKDYGQLDILKDIRPEDIEDVSERYIPLYAPERNSDVVKKVNISRLVNLKNEENILDIPLYLISLLEHKTKVEYNITMQILRYMVYIWEDYEKEMEKKQPGITKKKAFRYPPILPIVYYEGKQRWSAPLELEERILLGELLDGYEPHFSCRLVQLCDYSNEELLARGDEISLAMLINKIQEPEDVKEFINLPGERVDEILKDTPEYLLDVMAKVLDALMRRIHLSEEETEAAVSKIKERRMAVLFENITDWDVTAERRKSAEMRAEMEGARTELEGTRTELENTKTELEDMKTRLEDANAEIVRLREQLKSQNS